MKLSGSGPEMETLLRALSEKVRLRLLHLIGDTELCVCFFVEALRLPQPTISRHLAYLRKAEMVTARREGLWMHYRVVKPANTAVAKVLENVLAWCDTQPDMQTDRMRLSEACCAPEKFVRLENVPLPRKLR
jgi:ArsR family transcriptional regulator, arsenate/arsenite/antimonite-responsive transcriptional repressor